MLRIIFFIIISLLPIALISQTYNKDSLFNIATNNLESGNYTNAIELYSLYLKNYPDNNAYVNRAVAFWNIGDICGYCNDLKQVKYSEDQNILEAYNENCFKLIQIMVTNPDEKEKYGVDSILCFEQLCDHELSYYFIYSFNDYLDNYTENIDPVYVDCSILPKYQGGEQEMEDFIQNNISIDESTLLNNNFETINVTCTVEKNGKLSNIKSTQFIDYTTALEALRIARIMPEWSPAWNFGKKARAFITIPIKFKKPDNYKKQISEIENRYLAAHDTCGLCSQLESHSLRNGFLISQYPFCFKRDSLILKDNSIKYIYDDYTYSIVYLNKCKDDLIFQHFNSENRCINRLSINDTPPTFPGGDQARIKFISTTIKYPPYARDKGIQGIVYINFVVNTDGSITDIEIERSPDSDLSKEAIRVVKAMPKWTPAMQDDKPVKVKFYMPLKFTLQQ